jgi:hypothetical protein
MSKNWFDNVKKGKKHFAAILGLTALNCWYFEKYSLKDYVFGADGKLILI